MATPARVPHVTTTSWGSAHEVVRIHTHEEMQFVDLTEEIAGLVRRHRLEAGLVNVQSRHTTTAVVVNEHEPLLLEDFRRALQRVAPRLAGYAHDDFRRRRVAPGERVNGHAHCQALLLPTQAALNVAGGELQLGRWQRVFFVELDGGQAREVSVALMGEMDGPWP